MCEATLNMRSNFANCQHLLACEHKIYEANDKNNNEFTVYLPNYHCVIGSMV